MAIFGTFFAFTYAILGWVQDFAADYIESEAAERIDETVDSIRVPEAESALGRLAQSLADRNEQRIEELRGQLKAKAHEQIAAAFAEMRNLDCECRRKVARWIESGFETDIRLLQAANTRITDFVQYKYLEVETELKRDIRIFTASNAAAFLLLLLLSFVNPKATAHLFLPGLLLAVSTLVCSYFYLFQQNWLLTIIHGDYLGFAYLGWLTVVFGLLCDIALNHGRITTEIINAFLNAIGSALSVVPC